MPARARVRLPSPSEVEAKVLALPSVAEAVEAIASEVEAEARALAYKRAHDTGTYAALIQVLPAGGGVMRGYRTVAATDRKSTWLEEGTGIYGPRRRPIRPKRGKYLVFRVDRNWKGEGNAVEGPRLGKTAGDLVFAREVRGRPASWIMRDAAMVVAARHGARFVNHRPFQG